MSSLSAGQPVGLYNWTMAHTTYLPTIETHHVVTLSVGKLRAGPFGRD